MQNSSSNQTVVEFGSGDGTPVITCLMQSHFSGVIHGFELNPKAAALAESRAEETGVSRQYKVRLRHYRHAVSTIADYRCVWQSAEAARTLWHW